MTRAGAEDGGVERAKRSEARFSAAMEAVGVMWTNDATGRMSGPQPGWEQLTGQPQAAYQGYGWAAAVHPDDAKPTVDAWEEAVRQRRAFDFEHRVLRSDGAWRRFSIRAVPVIEGGEILEWVGVHIDITERAEAVAKLRASELRAQRILESITDGFFTLDHEWRFDYMNPEAERILGCEPGALLGRVIWEVYPGTVGTVFERAYRLVASGRQAASLEAFYPDHGRWYEARAFPLATGISVYFRDITEAKESDAALRASEERRRLALESAELGAWNIDIARETLTADARFCEILAGSPQPLTYAEALDSVHPDDRQRVIESVAAATRALDPAPYAIEYRVVHRDGAVRWVFAKGRANFEGDGDLRNVASFDGTVADITARRRSEEELRELAAELSEASRRKDEFLATLAHELRNPLAPIGAGVELMRRSGYEVGAVARVAAMLDRQVSQLSRLVDDLLDVSRVSRGELRLRKQPAALAGILAQAVEAIRPLVTAGGQELVARLPSDDVIVDADAARLIQVFSNLLTNAVKFSPPGSRLWLTVEAPSDTELMVSVRDEGAGIPAEMLGKIFEMFVQVDRTIERSQGGLGIGLTLAKRLLELHGGTLEARSEGEGRGSEFIARLPSAPLATRPRAALAAAPPVETQLRILVADDNAEAADLLAELLELMGNTVEQIADGQAAVAAARSFGPDVVILDIGMPALNGYEACRRIREQSPGVRRLIIALTGWGQDQDKQRAAEAGFDHHMVKPVDIGALERMLARFQAEGGR